MQKILLIDDDQMMLAALSMALQGHYTVVTAVSGEEGLKLWEAEKPDLIITDLTMPSMDGLELISHIRGIDKAVPIIATSGMLAGT